MIVEIDKGSGFCFGVINAIKSAENALENEESLYCLGDIVHNGREVQRLEKLGLISISKEEYFKLNNCKVLIRAHGEPPATYEYAKNNNIELIDATCPVVLNLQRKIKKSFTKNTKQNGQLVIFGKKGHAEIVGLDGQTNHNAIIIESIDDVEKIDLKRPVTMYSQTTKRVEEYEEIAARIKKEISTEAQLEIHDTICRQVSNRVPNLKEFTTNYDLVLFIAGKKSSNGKYLFSICEEANPNSKKISGIDEIQPEWFEGIKSVGICGATSTPNWLMEQAANWVKEKFA